MNYFENLSDNILLIIKEDNSQVNSNNDVPVEYFDNLAENILTKIKENEVTAANGFSVADVKFNTYGAGFNYFLNAHMKALVYYAVVQNESTKIAGYTTDAKDNVLTLRFQYRF